MAVTKFARERVRGHNAVSSEFGEDESHVARFVALTSDYMDGPRAVYFYSGCPKKGNIFQYGADVSAAAIVKSVKVSSQGGKFDNPTSGTAGLWKWLVEVDYSSAKDEKEEQPPGAEWAKVSFDTEQYDAPLEKDLDGHDVLNSCGMQFDPPAIFEDNRMIIRIDKSLPMFNYLMVDAVQNRVNASAFLGFPANTLRITKLNASPQEDSEFGFFYAVSVEMQYRRINPTITAVNRPNANHEPHQAYVLDVGRYQLAQIGQEPVKPRPILDADGQPVVDPVKLNGDGQELIPANQPGKYLYYRRYSTYDFNALGIYP